MSERSIKTCTYYLDFRICHHKKGGDCRSNASRRCFDDAKGTRFSSFTQDKNLRYPKKIKKYD